jgi:DNA-binding CsgD family transcriptional regulator
MITVMLAESSYIIRKGILQILNEFSEIGKVQEYATVQDLSHGLIHGLPDLIIANTYFDPILRDAIKEDDDSPSILLYLHHSPLPYGESPYHISIFEDKHALIDKIEQAIAQCTIEEKGDGNEDLSPREKLVLKQVALGRTNKEIADALYISTHTVISHRKNITKKLGIKTVSGLTVYAILNKIIGIEDIS